MWLCNNNIIKKCLLCLTGAFLILREWKVKNAGSLSSQKRKEEEMSCLSKKKFATMLKKEMGIRYPSLEIKIETIPKNNGVILTSLILLSQYSNISPTICLDSYYSDYLAGRPINDIVERICEVYDCNKTEGIQFDAKNYLKWKNVKDKICLKLINAEKNQLFLENVPHKLWNDLAIVYYVLLSEVEGIGEMASVLVRDNIFEYLGVDLEELHQKAMDNTKYLLKSFIKPLNNVLEEIISMESETYRDNEEVGLCVPENCLYIATNERKLFGAAAILDRELLSEFSKTHGDFYIIPASVHECLLLPLNSDFISEKEIVEMVKEVNATAVEDEEILSDSVYIYFSDTGFCDMLIPHEK